jgi:hypothetical protein
MLGIRTSPLIIKQKILIARPKLAFFKFLLSKVTEELVREPSTFQWTMHARCTMHNDETTEVTTSSTLTSLMAPKHCRLADQSLCMTHTACFIKPIADNNGKNKAT